jgi:hypothetical protein
VNSAFNIPAEAQPVLLGRFRSILRQQGSRAARTDETLLARSVSGRDELFYVPFEYMNCTARLVIVGISPGPNQIELAYDAAQARLKAGLSDEKVLEQAKREGSFGAASMRPNLVRMLEHFGIPQLLGITKTDDFWGVSWPCLHATSVVPHAAFRNGKPFAGSFTDVMESRPFRACFERDFAATLPLLGSDARYIALGPTPLAALDWCAQQRLVCPGQILGALAHPSTNGGSQVSVYLGKKRMEELSPGDPVRNRSWLVTEAKRMSRSVADWKASLPHTA